MSKTLRTAVMSGLVGLATLSPASAQQQARSDVEAWLASIDAQPNISVAYESLTTVGSRATLRGLTVRRSGDDPFLLVVDTAVIDGYRTLPQTGFAFDHLRIDRAQVQTQGGGFQLIEVDLSELSVPATGVAFDPEHPVDSIVAVYDMIAGISLDELSVGRIDIAQVNNGVLSVVTYHDYHVRDIANGRVGLSDAGPLTMEAPSPEGLGVVTVDRVTSEGMDLAAFINFFDPAAYSGAGDRSWQSLLEHGSYQNIIADAPGIRLRIGEIEVEDFRLRQTTQPIAAILEAISDPSLPMLQAEEMASDLGLEILSAFGFGTLRVKDLNLYADELDRFHLGEIYLDDFSLDGIGEIGIGDLDVVVGGEGWLRVDRFAIGGITMPSLEAIRDFLEVQSAGGEYEDILALLPTLGFVEASGIEIGQAGQLPVGLGRLQLILDGYLRAVPTAIGFAWDDLQVPLSLLDADSRITLSQMGFTEARTDFGLQIGWDESTSTLALQNLHVAIDGAGSLDAEIAITGVTREMLMDPEAMQEGAANLAFKSARLTATDETLTDRLFRWTAAGTDIPAEQSRDEFIRGLPFLIAFQFGNDLAARLAPPLQQFMRNPGTMTITLEPDSPVPLDELASVSTSAPWRLIDLLNLNIVVESAR